MSMNAWDIQMGLGGAKVGSWRNPSRGHRPYLFKKRRPVRGLVDGEQFAVEPMITVEERKVHRLVAAAKARPKKVTLPSHETLRKLMAED